MDELPGEAKIGIFLVLLLGAVALVGGLRQEPTYFVCDRLSGWNGICAQGHYEREQPR